MSHPRPPDRFRQTRTAILARDRLRRNLEGIGEDDPGLWYAVQDRVPEAWATLEEDVPTEEPKAKVTLWIDKSVIKVFRSMGKGYQARINRILATYIQMKIGEVNREAASIAAIRHTHGLPVPKETLSWLNENRDLLEDLAGDNAALMRRMLGETGEGGEGEDG